MATAVWTDTAMVRVLPGTAAPTAPQGRGGSPYVTLAMARGERASFQVLLRPAEGHGLREVRLEPSSLVDRELGAQIPASALEWHQVGFVRVAEILHPHRWGARTLAPGWYPDPLLPVESFAVPGAFTQPVWVTVHVPEPAPAGSYEGHVSVWSEDCLLASVRLSLTVYDVVLCPGAGRLRSSFDLIDGFLEQHYGRPVPAAVRRRYGQYLLEHRLNPDHFSRSEPPEIEDLRYFRQRGMNSFCAINLAKHRGCSIRGGLNSEPAWYTPSNWDALARRMQPFLDALDQNHDLRELAYVHGFDERDTDTHGDAMRLFFGRVQERWGLPTLTTSHIATDPALLRELCVDWLCPIWSQFSMAYDAAKAAAARAEGFKVWSYISLEPYSPYPNWRLDSPLMQARTIWWQVFQQKMDGFLYWGLNVWDRHANDRVIDPHSDGPLLDFSICSGGTHDWLYGDGVLLYPGREGPIGSMRLANIRDGLADHELLRMLREASDDDGVPAELCLPVASALDRYTGDPQVLRRQRKEVLGRLCGRGTKGGGFPTRECYA